MCDGGNSVPFSLSDARGHESRKLQDFTYKNKRAAGPAAWHCHYVGQVVALEIGGVAAVNLILLVIFFFSLARIKHL